VRIEAAGDSVDHAMSTLPGFYEGSRWSGSAGDDDFSYRYAALGDSSTMTLRTSRMRGYIEGDVPPGDDFVVQWIVDGAAALDLRREPMRLELGRPMLFPAHRSFVFGFHDYDQKLVHLNRGFVERVARERYAFRPGTLTFNHLVPPSDAAVERWMLAVETTTAALRSANLGPLAWQELSRDVALAFLALYPPSQAELPEPLLHPNNAHVRLILDYIHERAHEPLDLGDLAAVANLSARGVQVAFARLLGQSPMSYLRTVRLDRVHAELTVLEPTATSVAEIAVRWGFVHLGRFSAAYFKRFGRYPKDTLRA
jgi:AraC-like DNA-binding protein